MEKKVVSILDGRKDGKHCMSDVSTRTKIISFYGLEDGADIYLYLASILTKLGKRVLVIDNTKEHLFSECIPHLPQASGIIEYKYVSYVMDCGYDKALFYQYDVVINISGCVFEAEMECRSDLVYVVTDFQKIHIKMVQEIIKKLTGKFSIVYRDFDGGCVDAAYLDAVFGELLGNVDERIVLSVTKEDYLNSLQMQYNNTFRFDKLTYPYREFIIRVVQTICHEYVRKVPEMFQKKYHFPEKSHEVR